MPFTYEKAASKRSGDDLDIYWQELRAAIAKARGEERGGDAE